MEEKVTVKVTGMDADWEKSGDAAIVIVLEKVGDDKVVVKANQRTDLAAIPPRRYAVSVGGIIRKILERIAMQTDVSIRELATNVAYEIIGPEMKKEEESHE